MSTFNLNIFSIIFATILLIIAIYILNKLIKSEKQARPFLISLSIYFFLMSLVSYIQSAVFIIYPNLEYDYGIYNDYFAVVLIYLAPIALIYEIEKIYFPEKKIFSKYHIITSIVIILTALFLIFSIYDALFNPAFFYPFEMRKYWYINYSSWTIIVVFICVSFFYLGTKTTGLYRRYSYLICLGWAINQIINAAVQLLEFNVVIQLIPLLIIFSIKFLGAILTAYGFYKLYSLSIE
ncbi:MAG: hypothetical protein ACTSRP_04555 [Candidatus Helarchaeota archaeon]